MQFFGIVNYNETAVTFFFFRASSSSNDIRSNYATSSSPPRSGQGTELTVWLRYNSTPDYHQDGIDSLRAGVGVIFGLADAMSWLQGLAHVHGYNE